MNEQSDNSGQLQSAEALRQAVHDALGQALGDSYDCTRVWEAWQVGTMSQDDFSLITDDSDRMWEITDVVLAALAARQPVGDGEDYQQGYQTGYSEGVAQYSDDSQRPVAWRGFCSDGVEFETCQTHCEANPGYWQPLYAAPPAPAAAPSETFQAGVSKWMGECFLPSLYSNMTERGDRLLEEVLELLQSNGYDPTRVATLVDYVYGRPVGEPAQEVGGVMVTLAGYCWVAGLDMHAEGARELERITQPEVMAKIRRKQEAKNALNFDTPLPGQATAPQPAAATGVPELFVQWLEREMPAGTIIGKPAWWAPKLARALRSAERGVLGGCNG